MKTPLALTTLLIAPLALFAQGKVQFVNDSLHLVYFATDNAYLFTADMLLAGQPVPAGGATPSGFTLDADLWVSTSGAPYSWQRVGTDSFDNSRGGFLQGSNITLPDGLPGGVQYFFQVAVYDPSSYRPYGYSVNVGYFGESPVFTCYASSTSKYYNLSQTTSPAFSSWPVGSQDESAATGLAGARGSIEVKGLLGPYEVIMSPEPSIFALTGLGALMMLLHRKRTNPS